MNALVVILILIGLGVLAYFALGRSSATISGSATSGSINNVTANPLTRFNPTETNLQHIGSPKTFIINGKKYFYIPNYQPHLPEPLTTQTPIPSYITANALTGCWTVTVQYNTSYGQSPAMAKITGIPKQTVTQTFNVQFSTPYPESGLTRQYIQKAYLPITTYVFLSAGNIVRATGGIIYYVQSKQFSLILGYHGLPNQYGTIKGKVLSATPCSSGAKIQSLSQPYDIGTGA
jgi:hypothetical protein